MHTSHKAASLRSANANIATRGSLRSYLRFLRETIPSHKHLVVASSFQVGLPQGPMRKVTWDWAVALFFNPLQQAPDEGLSELQMIKVKANWY